LLGAAAILTAPNDSYSRNAKESPGVEVPGLSLFRLDVGKGEGKSKLV
jgi:hypothetical protein